MTRKTPISAVDLAISKRLGQARKGINLSRHNLAIRSGVSIGVITRVELGRSPLRYKDARRILRTLDREFCSETTPINPLWLAEGIEPTRVNWPFLLPDNSEIDEPDRLLFSAFVAKYRALLEADSLIKIPM